MALGAAGCVLGATLPGAGPLCVGDGGAPGSLLSWNCGPVPAFGGGAGGFGAAGGGAAAGGSGRVGGSTRCGITLVGGAGRAGGSTWGAGGGAACGGGGGGAAWGGGGAGGAACGGGGGGAARGGGGGAGLAGGAACGGAAEGAGRAGCGPLGRSFSSLPCCAITSGAVCACEGKAANCIAVRAVVASSTKRSFVMVVWVPRKNPGQGSWPNKRVSNRKAGLWRPVKAGGLLFLNAESPGSALFIAHSGGGFKP